MSEKIELFTIGHSSRTFDHFLALLREFKIAILVDIRRFPGSRKFPHFNRQSLEKTLPAAGIDYVWLEDLGGRRSGVDIAESPNLGLRHSAFRYYADYMHTDSFRSAVSRLMSVASEKPTAVMCAEKLFWKCHRRLLSDYMVAQGVLVEHIMDSGHLQSHKLSAVITADLRVIYPSSGPDVNTPSLFFRDNLTFKKE
ncbi:MAG: DUF488 domain-containing protein [Sedimentisphaerales bacterium]|jgi:uncharacterized protein (DUF488 family)